MQKRSFVAGCCLALLAAAPLAADTLLTKRRDADEFVFQGRSTGGKNQRVQVWIATDRARRDNGRSGQILRLDQHKLYLFDHTERVFTVLDVHEGRDRLVAKYKSPLPTLAETEAAWRAHARIIPTGEKREVAGRPAEGYRVELTNETGTAARTKLQWWTAPDLRLDDLPLRKLMRLLASLLPMGDEWIADLLALPGHLVLFLQEEQQPDVVVTAREELLSVEEKEAPAGTYDPPAGYRPLEPTEYSQTVGWPAVF
jgi:hypothetical protein